jgi:sialate O-acetylesterase
LKLRDSLVTGWLSAATIFLSTASSSSAQVTLPRVLSDHMVVQRDLPVHVWGNAAPGEGVMVSFRGDSRGVTTDLRGHWSVYLKPGAAGGTFELTVTGTPPLGGTEAAAQTITLTDVLVGDVWVASGQSNMEFAMRQAATASADLPQAANPQIRLMIVKKKASEFPLADVETDASWAASTPETAKGFSAVGWYFAREIAAREHVPVGVIDSTWGGTVAEAWTRLEALGQDAALAPIFTQWAKMTQGETDAQARQADEQRQIAEAKAAGKPAPEFPWHPPLLSWGPGMLWNGMIAPLTPLPIRGVIWYQGESNSKLDRAPYYERVFSTMISDWRHEWGVGDFPFLFVQISNFKSNGSEDWAELRDQQLKTLKLRNTAMAVTIDIGNPDNVHPTDKVDVGLRLALAARALSYGEDVSYSGPIFRQATPEGNAIRVWFDHHAKGLTAQGGELTGFDVAGADGRFVAGKATIDGNTVVVTSDTVMEPKFVRYGWANSPLCNLFNGEGLPASPFNSME